MSRNYENKKIKQKYCLKETSVVISNIDDDKRKRRHQVSVIQNMFSPCSLS